MKQKGKKILIFIIAFILIYTNWFLTISTITNSVIALATDIADDEETEEFNEEEETNEEIGTKAELGINVNELSTTLENDIQFTITLFTNKNTYDLFKNPQFIIELPECIEEISPINQDEVVLLNNKASNDEDIFNNLQIDEQEVNNRKYIVLGLEGEQGNYTQSSINNTQIVIPVKIKTSNLLPTKEEQINLYYSNENVTTYNTESQSLSNYGEYNKDIKFVAPTGILTETTINVLEETVKNYRNQSNKLLIPSKADNNGMVKVIAVNNTGRNIENAKILGKSQILQEITGNELISVKYSTNEEAEANDDSWVEEYTAGVKSYLIEIGEFNQGEVVEYTYNISVPEVENDTEFKEEFAILNNDNEIIVERTNSIEVKTVHLNVKIEPSVGENKAIYAGQEFSYIITVENIGEIIAHQISINSILPNNISLVGNDAITSWDDIELAPGESITKRILVKAKEDITDETTIECQVQVNAENLRETIINNTESTIKESDLDINFTSIVSKNSMTTENVEIGSILEYNLSLRNKTTEEKNITIIANLPENVDPSSIGGTVLIENEETGFWNPEEDNEITIVGNKITIQTNLNANNEKYVSIYGIVDKYTGREVKAEIKVLFDEEEMNLEGINNAITPADISVDSAEYKNNIIITEEDIELSNEDELSYIIKIKNTGETAEGIEISAEIDDVLEVQSIEYRSFLNNIIWNEEDLSNDFGISGERLAKDEEGILIVKTKLYRELTETTEITSEFKIAGTYTGAKVIQFKNRIMVDVETPTNPENPDEPEVPDNPDNPGNPDDPEVPENPDEPTIPETHYYSISGVAWLDENENGIKEENETKLSNIRVNLLKNDIIQKGTTTDINGKYMFQDVLEGDYIIVFDYDKTQYKPTIPKKDGVEEYLNSDAYEVNINGLNITKTDMLAVSNDIKNIDIGLIKNSIFNFSIKKQISKITVNNQEGTKIINYKNEELAKIEIPSKSYIGTNLIIEYSITIENTGDITGYAYTIADIIPGGTEFISEMNPDWYEYNGVLYNISLAEEEILPGEQKEVKIILTKQLEEDSAVSIKNKAEIVETFNEKLIAEDDLKDNISEAELIVSVKTGNVKEYVLLIIAILTIIGTSIYIIKKKVL